MQLITPTKRWSFAADPQCSADLDQAGDGTGEKCPMASSGTAKPDLIGPRTFGPLSARWWPWVSLMLLFLGVNSTEALLE